MISNLLMLRTPQPPERCLFFGGTLNAMINSLPSITLVIERSLHF